MKKLINRPEDVVEDMIEGLLATNPGLARLSHHTVLVRADAEHVRDSQVALISGGGSGHEPAHAGYVGAGMLSAAVAGQVFTSPSVDSIYAAIKAVTGGPGALLIVKNYTGDRLNFGLAAEWARADGIATETVIVGDDVALAGAEHHAGARGIAGTVLVHKVAGAAAADGRDLAEVARIACATADCVGTMGVSLSACTVPAIGKPSFVLDDSEVELGLGIHGEAGVCRITLASADALAGRLVHAVISARRMRSGERIAVLINNLGSTTPMELAIVGRGALAMLESHGFIVERVYSGTFMSSLDMAGASISLLRVDEDRLRWLDAPTSAPAWHNSIERPVTVRERVISSELASTDRDSLPREQVATTKTEKAVRAVCRALMAAEGHLTELDQAVGDGDLGLSLSRGAKAIEAALPRLPVQNPAMVLKALAIEFQRVVGGSSGPLYGVFLLRAAHSLENSGSDDALAWARACLEGCQAISELGGAVLGDRTMLDALIPFAQTLRDGLVEGKPVRDAVESALRVAEAAADATAQMIPRRGRSSYLGKRALGTPDPGAIAVAVGLRALVSVI